MAETPQDGVNSFRTVLLAHAADLLSAAQAELPTHPNIAYHLAVLCLEELGKLELVEMGTFLRREFEREERPDDLLDDHVRKLFWALWGPTFGQKVITKEQIAENQALARELHDMRLRGLYVERPSAGATTVSPSISVTTSHAQPVVELAKKRFELAQLPKKEVLAPDEQELVAWFLDAMRDEDQRRFAMSRTSMEKLAELSHSKPWFAWLREHFDSQRREVAAWLARERERPQSSTPADDAPKWKLRLRLYTVSHSIRQKPLNQWNEVVERVKLFAVSGKKDELLVEIILPKVVGVDGVPPLGFDFTNRVLFTLNVATQGFFYPTRAQYDRLFFERLTDLETNAIVDLRIPPILAVNWGQKGVLDDAALRRGLMVLGFALREEPHAMFEHYMLALATFAKTDQFTHLEAQSFIEFFRAAQEAMRYFGDWDGESDVAVAFRTHVASMLPPEDCGQFLAWGLAEDTSVPVPLDSVVVMKALADLYFCLRIDSLARAEKERRQKTAGTGSGDVGVPSPTPSNDQ